MKNIKYYQDSIPKYGFPSDQTWDGYILYLDTFVNFSNVTVTYLDTLQKYLNFGYMIILNIHV